MMTYTCTLTKHGKAVTAQVTAATAHDEPAVVYSGATDLLPRTFREASAAQLRALFQNIAREIGADFQQRTDGEYDAAE